MGKAQYRNIQCDDRDLNLVQDSITLITADLQDTPFCGGNLPNSSTKSLTTYSVTLKTGQSNLIPHGLGRAAIYFILLGQDTNTNVWRVVGNAALEKNLIDLRCGANCNVKVWVN